MENMLHKKDGKNRVLFSVFPVFFDLKKLSLQGTMNRTITIVLHQMKPSPKTGIQTVNMEGLWYGKEHEGKVL